MMDPKRLLDGEGNALEQRMLAAAREDVPSAALENMMRAGLGLPLVGLPGAPIAPSPTAPSAPSSPSTPPPALAPVTSTSASNALWLKVVGVAALVGVGALTLWGLKSSDSAGASGARNGAEAAPAAQPVTNIVAEQAAPEPAPQRERGPIDPGAAAQLGADKASAPKGSPRSPALEVSTREARLREEIALIDGMRGALSKDDSALALSRYRTYVSRFPDGTLREEAEALRVEATRRSGDAKRADALARRFETEHPESPHLGRVRGAASASPSSGQAAPK